MSGGYFEWKDRYLKDEIFGWTDRCYNALEDREISELVWDVLNLLHDYDWYKSADTCEETYLEKKAAFKKKWFGSDRSVRLKQYVDDALQETKEELYKTFCLEDPGESGGE